MTRPNALRLQGAAKCDFPLLSEVADTGRGEGSMRKLHSEQLRQFAALAVLLVIAGFAVAGPTGLLAWSEHLALRDQRHAEIAVLTAKRDALRNRVMLLDPQAADPDLASELVRENLGVMHEDEVVLTLDDN
ncbi:MAG: FtsB family cell division protein [Erythrobacter sp.]